MLALYVRGLPTECTEADLEKVFSEYGPLRKGPRPAVSIYPNKNPPKNPSVPHGRCVLVTFIWCSLNLSSAFWFMRASHGIDSVARVALSRTCALACLIVFSSLRTRVSIEARLTRTLCILVLFLPV